MESALTKEVLLQGYQEGIFPMSKGRMIQKFSGSIAEAGCFSNRRISHVPVSPAADLKA